MSLGTYQSIDKVNIFSFYDCKGFKQYDFIFIDNAFEGKEKEATSLLQTKI